MNARLAAALYGPFGIAGIVLGTVVGTVAMCVAQGCCCAATSAAWRARARSARRRGCCVAAALLAAVAYGVWYGLDAALGRSLVAQAVSVLTALTAGVVVYAAAVWAMRVPEALQIRRLLMSRGVGS